MPLDNPIRLEVQKRLSALFDQIAIADGYAHDMDGRVFRGRGVFGDETPVPAISILEVPIPIDQFPSPADSSLSSGAWELMIQGFVPDDRDNPTDPAHLLLADVKKILALERKKVDWNNPEDGIFGLGTAVTGLRIGPGVVRPPDELSGKAYFWLTIEVDLAEDLAEPYEA